MASTTEKLVVTLWRGQIRNPPQQLYGVYCRLKFGTDELRSKTVRDTKLLPWKQSFVFHLVQAPKQDLKLEFVNLSEGEEIHFAKDEVAGEIGFARAVVPIVIEKNVARGTVPKKVDIVNQKGETIGKVFLEYELLKNQVRYMIEKGLQYKFMLAISQVHVSFVRNLQSQPVFFLKATFGEQVRKQQFPMACIKGEYFYNYPIRYYIKNQPLIRFQLVSKSGASHAPAMASSPKKGLATESQSESVGKVRKRKMSVESVGLYSTYDIANVITDRQTQEKIPIYIPPQREVGSMQFNTEVVFKVREEVRDTYGRVIERGAAGGKGNGVGGVGAVGGAAGGGRGFAASVSRRAATISPKKVVNIKAQNGYIVVNSIIARLEPLNDDLIKHKDFSIELKIGKQRVESSTLQRPGTELIFIDNFKFKRTWQQKIQFSIIVKDLKNQPSLRNPIFFTQANLRELFETGRFLAKHLVLVDDEHHYCGELIVDVSYEEEDLRKGEGIIAKREEQANKQEKELKDPKEIKAAKLEKIKERMKKRDEIREVREAKSIDYSFDSLLLPPISERVNASTILPKSPGKLGKIGKDGKYKNRAISQAGRYSPPATERKSIKKIGAIGLSQPKINIFNTGPDVKFSQSPRFKQQKPAYDGPLISKLDSDFDAKGKGASIGYGNKLQLGKPGLPGVGRYQIPSLWDKYN